MDIDVPQLIERWENGLRVLKAMDAHEREKHFSMTVWGRKTDCGTVACAAGTFSLDPWFKERGFSSHWYEPEGNSDLIPTLEADDGSWGNMIRNFFKNDDMLDDHWTYEQSPEIERIAYRGAQIFYRDRAGYAQVVDHIEHTIGLLKGYLERNPVTPAPAGV